MYDSLDFDKKLASTTQTMLQEFKVGPSGKLEPTMLSGAAHLPWIFMNHDARMKFCWFWNHVCTRRFNIIPTNCRFNCWKIVIKPNNVKELFECYEILKQLDLPSKIGMDLRDYTYGAWAGFVYNDTLEEGRSHFKQVRAAMPKKVPVILKRGCTEMEQIKPSKTWNEMAEADLAIEKKLMDRINFQERHFIQGKWQKEEIKENWIKHAIKIGDPTARETAEKYSDDPDIWNKLVVVSDTYHDTKEE
jgi:hypothetical protein